jgi:hypothetical protein
VDIRPRTLGEILDDAWRLALADAPLLLVFNALFLVPAFIVLLLLLAQPVPAGIAQGLLPALAAVLLPLTGLASGACQGLFRQRLTSPQRQQGHEQPLLGLRAGQTSLRRGLKHAAARGVLLCFTLPGPLLLMASFLPDISPILRFVDFLFGSLLTFLLSLPLWGACTSLHVLLSMDTGRSATLLGELRRDVAAAPGKAAVLVLSRLPLLFLLALQLHLLAKILLWAADNLGGFDTTLLDVQLVLFENPVYTLALFLLSWLLLAPFFEAGNFLLHTDIRTRQEGLDLQYRVQRAFGGRSAEPRPLASGLLRSLTLAALIVLGGMARAQETPRETIHAIRGEIDTIHAEIEKAEPYPGGQRWQARLRSLQTKLTRIGGGDPRRFRWFEQEVDVFADRKKEDAMHILDDIRRCLSLLEESLTEPAQPAEQAKEKHSPEDIKSLLRGSEGRKVERNPPRQHVEEDRPEVRREKDRGQQRHGEAPQAGGGKEVPVSEPGASGGGLSFLGWLLLGGLALAVVVVGLFLYLTSPRSPRTPKMETVTGTNDSRPENDARQVLEQAPAALWRQADTLAADGRYREAVRVLYLAVLALLHRQRLIRFEPTRTNGEYVRQVRLSEQAPPELHGPFQELTNLFETVWYGERPCESGDYRACRTLADATQQIAGRV